MAGPVRLVEIGKAPKRSVAFALVCQGTFIGCFRAQEFQELVASPIVASRYRLRARRRSHDRTESQMTKIKMLSAAIILSAAIATPVFAQDAGVRETGNGYGLARQPSSRGAYNQLSGPSNATTRT